MANLKKFNIFIFITSFSKLLVELFIPLILYNRGFGIKKIFLFLIIKYSLCVLFVPIGRALGNMISYAKLMVFSSVLFSLTYVYLNFMKSIFVLAILYSAYLMFYWLGRHIYAISIIEEKKATENVSLYNIFTILGGLFSTYIGAVIIDMFGYLVLSIIVLVLMVISIFPLIKIKDVKISDKKETFKIFKSFPIRNYTFITLDQLRYIICSIYPLYIYIYVRRTFSFAGVLNIISGVGSILYIYILSKKMDKNKKDYLSLSLLLMGFIYVFKLFVYSKYLFLIIVFVEGVIKSSVDTITLRNTYCYGKNYDVISYVAFIEIINNVGRTLFLVLFYLLDLGLMQIILVSVIGLFLNVFVKFDDGKFGYSKVSAN